jgi:hypothetical protein
MEILINPSEIKTSNDHGVEKMTEEIELTLVGCPEDYSSAVNCVQKCPHFAGFMFGGTNEVICVKNNSGFDPLIIPEWCQKFNRGVVKSTHMLACVGNYNCKDCETKCRADYIVEKHLSSERAMTNDEILILEELKKTLKKLNIADSVMMKFSGVGIEITTPFEYAVQTRDIPGVILEDLPSPQFVVADFLREFYKFYRDVVTGFMDRLENNMKSVFPFFRDWCSEDTEIDDIVYDINTMFANILIATHNITEVMTDELGKLKDEQ